MSYKKLDIKKPPEYFFNSMTNIMKLNTSSVGINEISFADNDVIYGIGYYENFDSASSLYLIFNNVDAYFMSFNKDKYLIFAKTEKK